MKLTILPVLITLFLYVTVSALDFKCSRSDSKDCYLFNLMKLIPYSLIGVPEYDIPQMEPLNLPVMVFNRSLSANTEIVAILKNLQFLGYSDVQFSDITVDLKTNSGEMKLLQPQVFLQMDHSFDGKLLNVPLGIKGNFKGNFTNINSTVKAKFLPIKRGNEHYFQLDDLKLAHRVGDGQLHMTSENSVLQQLTDIISNLFNNNPRLVLDLFNPLYSSSVERVMQYLANRALQRVPAKDLLPELQDGKL